jgi:AcrR family transcriptional regulator
VARDIPRPAQLPRRLDPDARRAQLVQLGLELIKARPFDQVLIDEVIAAAGISKGLLFHYFPTKRDFQVSVIRAAAADLLARLAPDPALPPLEQLRAGIGAYIGYIEQQPASYTAIVRGAGSDEALLTVFEDTRDAIVELIATGVTLEPTPLLRLAVRGWIAGVEEAAILWLRDKPCGRDTLVELQFQAALQLLPLVEHLSEPESATG